MSINFWKNDLRISTLRTWVNYTTVMVFKFVCFFFIQNQEKNWIGQTTYTVEVLKKFQMGNSKPTTTPYDAGAKLIKATSNSELFDKGVYQSAIFVDNLFIYSVIIWWSPWLFYSKRIVSPYVHHTMQYKIFAHLGMSWLSVLIENKNLLFLGFPGFKKIVSYRFIGKHVKESQRKFY